MGAKIKIIMVKTAHGYALLENKFTEYCSIIWFIFNLQEK
jgi:hypothetical protein